MALPSSLPAHEVCGVSSGSLRVAWVCPCGEENCGDDPDLSLLCREEAIQKKFLRLSEQYLKGEQPDMPLLGAWRRR